jgi:putative DNA primase/helicase
MWGYRQWFIYQLFNRDPATGKYEKQPIDARTRKMPAKDQGGINQCCDWDTVAQVGAELQATAGAGVLYVPGFYFTAADPFWFHDIDQCVIRDAAGQPAWSELVLKLLGMFPNAARELSSSQQGWHVIGSGTAPEHRCKNTELKLEFYTADRGVAISGFHASGSAAADCTTAVAKLVAEYFPPNAGEGSADDWRDGPVEHWVGPAEDDKLIELALSGKIQTPAQRFGKKATFAELWEGTAAAKWFNGDENSSDQSLFNSLAFLTGKDCARMERMIHRAPVAAIRRKGKYSRPDYLERTILEACRKCKGVLGEKDSRSKDIPPTPTATDEDPRESIILTGGKLDQYAAQAERLIADTIYVRGGSLVRIGRAAEISNELLKDASGIARDGQQAICIPASAAWLRRELMARAQFWKYDKRSNDWEPKDCPKELAENIGDQEAWATFRPLMAISPVPILRPDMTVWAQPGYDAMTGVFYQPTMTVPDFPAVPTREDALAALQRLWDPVSEFPFASKEAASVFLSHVIGAVLRPSFDTSPIFLYTAPMAATGKTLLAGMPNLIAHGVLSAHNPYSEGEELRKVLFSSLLAGDATLILDNVPSGVKVRAPGLCNFATSSTVGDRVLGASENRKVPNRCTVVLTGNNITPAGDMARRSLPCRLDVNAETARGRKFRIRDLKGYVVQRRAQLIVDVLTIVRAYDFAGRPEVAHPLESFEAWSRLVRDPLVWLGTADPVASQETETDDEVAPLQGAFAAIATATVSQGHIFTAGQLASIVQLQAQLLRDVLVNAGCSEPADAKKLGYWLREQKDRVAGGWKLVSEKGAHKSVAQWRLRSV